MLMAVPLFINFNYIYSTTNTHTHTHICKAPHSISQKMEHPRFIFLATLFTIASRGISQVSDCKPGNNGSKVAVTVVVDHSGMGNFKRIQEAIDSVPANNDRWIKVQINPGTYT